MSILRSRSSTGLTMLQSYIVCGRLDVDRRHHFFIHHCSTTALTEESCRISGRDELVKMELVKMELVKMKVQGTRLIDFGRLAGPAETEVSCLLALEAEPASHRSPRSYVIHCRM